MKTNYANDDLKKAVKDAKNILGVNEFYCFATYVNAYGVTITERVIRKTANGISSYANKMFSKYGENVTVKVIYFYRNIQITLTTYSA